MVKKLIAVPWHYEPVYIFGVPEKLAIREIGFQIYVYDWLKKLGIAKNWHHSGNERKGLQDGLIMKRMGQSKGFPDFINPIKKLAMELKIEGNEPTQEQEDWLLDLESVGYKVCIPYDFDSVKCFISEAYNLQA